MPLKPQKVSTEADALMNLLREVREVSLEDVSRTLGVPVATVEKWASFLEEERLLSVKFRFTTPYLVYNPPVELKRHAAESFREELIRKDDEPDDSNVRETKSLVQKAESEAKKGDFSSVKNTIFSALSKTKSVREKIQLEPLKRAHVDKRLTELELALNRASDYAESGKFDIAHKLYSSVVRELKDLALSMERLYLESRRKSQVEKITDLKQLLDRAYALMMEGKLDESRQIYDELKASYTRLPAEFMQRKVEVEKNLLKLSKDLSIAMGREAVHRFREGSASLRTLIATAKQELSKGSLAKAEEAYIEIKRGFDALPHGFVKERQELERQILELFQVISARRKDMITSTIGKKVAYVEMLVKEIGSDIKSGSIARGVEIYNKVKALYDSIPNEFVHEKLKLQRMVMKAYMELAQSYSEKSTRDFEKACSEIKGLVALMSQRTGSGDIEGATGAYEQAKALFSRLAPGFVQEKSELQRLIVTSYENLISKSASYVSEKSSRKMADIDRMVSEAFSYVGQGRHELAEEEYILAIREYNSLPAGFSYEKTALMQRMLDLYREIMLNKDLYLLRKTTPDVSEKYHDVMKLLIQARHSIEQRQFSLLEIQHSHIMKIFNEMPIGFVNENLKLKENINRLAMQVEFYKKVTEAEKASRERSPGFEKIVKDAFALKEKLPMPESKPLADYLEQKRALFQYEEPVPVSGVAQATQATAAEAQHPYGNATRIEPVASQAPAPQPAQNPGEIGVAVKAGHKRYDELFSMISGLKVSAKPSVRMPLPSGSQPALASR